MKTFLKVFCWMEGEFSLYSLSFGPLRSKVQKMNQTPRRLRRAACSGPATILALGQVAP